MCLDQVRRYCARKKSKAVLDVLVATARTKPTNGAVVFHRLIHWTERAKQRTPPGIDVFAPAGKKVIRARRWMSSPVTPPDAVTTGGIVRGLQNGADDKLCLSPPASRSSMRKDPRKRICDPMSPFFARKRRERVGQVPNVVFVEAWCDRAGGASFIRRSRTN